MLYQVKGSCMIGSQLTLDISVCAQKQTVKESSGHPCFSAETEANLSEKPVHTTESLQL